MSDEQKPHSHGKHPDGVYTYAADAHDMATYGVAQQAMAKMPVPIFQHASNPHERIFIAAFDGTWNDAEKDPLHLTNVGRVRNQIMELKDKNPDAPIALNYVKGVGTQDNFVERTLDGAFGYTYDKRLEEMYENFIKQADRWIVAELPTAERHEALCCNLAHLVSYIESKGAHEKDAKVLRESEKQKRIRDMDWWALGEAGEFPCPENT